MEFRGMEGVVIELLRTPELQRLRKVRQLGLVHLVFPGAEHTRLVHCLGAAHLAVRFGRHLEEKAQQFFTPALCPDESSIRDLALAALCHDLGHGPLSHAWERVIIGHRFDRTAWAKVLGLSFSDDVLQRLKWHEMVGHALLQWPDGQLHRLLDQHEKGSSDRISQLLLGNYYIPYMPRLLSSDVDVDRADFIRRDTHHTGVAYGRYDLDWLLSTCTLGYRSVQGTREWLVGFDERKAVRVVEQFLIARRALYETVYHHRTVRCAEGMVSLFLKRLKNVLNDGTTMAVADFVRPMIEMIQGNAVGPHEILTLDDFALSVLIDTVAQSTIKDDTVRDLARRIRERDLFKQVPVSKQVLNRYLRSDSAKEKLYEAVKPYAPGDAEYYVFIDEASFSMLANRDAEKVCLITPKDQEAIFANDHPEFDAHRHADSEDLRVFTLREAVDSLQACITSET